MENEKRVRSMYDWEEDKLIAEAKKKEAELIKKEREHLEKEHKRVKGKQAFKHWLKESLVQQTKANYDTMRATQEKKAMEAEKEKHKENMKVMAKIAFREWKERKSDEAREKREMQKKDRTRTKLEQQEVRMARLEAVT